MKLRVSLACIAFLFLCLTVVVATYASPQSRQRDPIGGLKRAITDAGAPALTADQETKLNNLIEAFRVAEPEGSNEALKAAREAYHNAILAGDLAGAQAQAGIIATQTAEMTNARLQSSAKFNIDVLAVLSSGGQLETLKQKFGNERLLGLIGSLGGGPFGGGRSGRGFAGGPR